MRSRRAGGRGDLRNGGAGRRPRGALARSPRNHTSSARGIKSVDRIVIHVTEGSFWGSVRWLRNHRSHGSSHYVSRAAATSSSSSAPPTSPGTPATAGSTGTRSGSSTRASRRRGGFTQAQYERVREARRLPRRARRHARRPAPRDRPRRGAAIRPDTASAASTTTPIRARSGTGGGTWRSCGRIRGTRSSLRTRAGSRRWQRSRVPKPRPKPSVVRPGRGRQGRRALGRAARPSPLGPRRLPRRVLRRRKAALARPRRPVRLRARPRLGHAHRPERPAHALGEGLRPHAATGC